MRSTFACLLLCFFLATETCASVPSAPVPSPSFCDSLQAALDNYNAEYPGRSGVLSRMVSTIDSAIGWIHYDSATANPYASNDAAYLHTQIIACGFTFPNFIDCALADSAMSRFYADFPMYDSVAPPFLWAAYLNKINGTNAVYGNRYSSQDLMMLLGWCGIGYPVPGTLSSYCDTIQAVNLVYNDLYPNSGDGNLYAFYMSVVLNTYGNTLQYWFDQSSGCGFSCPSVINCTMADSVMTEFYTLFPQYSVHAPAFVWTAYLNASHIGWNSTQDWLPMLSCCGIPVPSPDTVHTYCDSLNTVVGLYYALYPESNTIWDFTATLSTYFPGQHYDSVSATYVNNNDIYWFNQLHSCGISCPDIINCENVSNLMTSFKSQYPQYDSVAPSFIWADYLNENGGGNASDGNTYTYSAESWLALFTCCNITAPLPQALGNHCDTVNTLLANIPGIGSAHVYLDFIPDALNNTFGYQHYDSASAQKINNDFNYWYTQLNACGDSCCQIVNCDSINATILGINSNQIDTSVSYAYSLPVIEAYIAMLNGNGGDPSLWEPILRCSSPMINFTDTVLSHCDTALILRLEISNRFGIQSDSCLPYWVYNFMLNSGKESGSSDTTIYQLCSDLTACNLKCLPYCTSTLASGCDSAQSAYYVYNLLLATEGGPTSDSSMLHDVFQLLYGRELSFSEISSLLLQCSPACDSFARTVSVNSPVICLGDAMNLTATVGSSYLWNTSDTSQSIFVSTAGTYNVTVTNPSGCTASASATAIVHDPPFPPATPVFLSECSDTAYSFLIDYVTAWGDNMQWSADSNFTTYTTEYPSFDTYYIDPFAISVPGDSSLTVWFRTVSPEGCVSSSASAILETDRLPIQRNIFAIDTIVPQDSTTTIVVPNSQNGFLYTLQIGYTVVASASGTGDTIYISTPPIDTPTVIDVYATNTVTTCQRHLYSGRYRSHSRVDSASNIYVTISHSSPVQACQPDTLYLSVSNNTSSLVDSVVLNLLINNPDFTLADTTLNNRIGSSPHASPIITISGSHYQIALNTIPADSTWSFSMMLFTSCSEIPDEVPVSGGVVVPKNDTSNRIYAWVSGPNDTVGVNNQANVTVINPYHITLDSILYPIFDVDIPQTTGFDSVGGIYTYQSGSLNEYKGCVSLGDTFTRRSYFINKGAAVFTGGISIRDSMTCDGLTLIRAKIYYSNKTVALSSADSAMLMGSGYEHNLSDGSDTVGAGSELVLEETFAVAGCLGSACESKIILTWGCDTTNLCKTDIPTPYTFITYNCKQPAFLISRILPGSNYNSSLDAYWDSTCINTSTKWEFEVQNADTASTTTLTNVHVVLNKGLVGSYSYINWSTFRMGFRDSLYGSALPVEDSLSYRLRILTAHIFDSVMHYTSACLQNPNIDSPLLSIDMRIARLKRGDKFFFSFYTYQCCPSDTELFNTPFTMNHWKLDAYGFYCGANGGDSVIATPLDRPSGSPPYYASTIFHDSDQPDAISPYAHNQGNDFGLTQVFTPGLSTMNRDETDTFCIRNLSLGSVAFTDYQLLFQHGYNNGASTPSFRLIVDISTQTGLWVNPAGRVHISGHGYTWPGTIVSNGPTFTEVAFDVSALGLVDSAVLGVNGASAFKSFFEGSYICFPLTSFCPAVQPTVGVQIRTYIEPKLSAGCDTCKIPLSQVGTGIHVLCPGCVTPGIQIIGSTIKRINFGLPDSSDIGYADNTTPITPTNYAQFGSVDKGIAMVGDTLRSYTVEDFDDGDPAGGFTYAGWDSFWTAHGDTNAYFRYLFRDINIPYSKTADMNLRLITDSLYYTPAGSSITYAIPLPVDSQHVVHTGDNFIFRVSIDSIRAFLHDSTISFKPRDEYRFCSYYVICGNFSIPAGSNNGPYECATTLFSYFTTPPNSGFVFPSYEVGDYFSAHMDTTGHISNDSIVAPEASIYYLCVGAAPIFYDCYVKYDANGYDYSDYNGLATRCIKPLYMSVSAEILGPNSDHDTHYYDDFPYEFRPIPGLTTGAHININDVSSPYAFMIKSLGGCYTMAPSYTQTTAFIHPTTSGGTGQYTFDTVPSGFYSVPAGPYERYSFPSLYAYATPQNVPTNPHNSLPLRIGDEYFKQQLQFLITAPVCTGCPDTLYDNTDLRLEAIVVPPVSICSAATDTFFSNAYNSALGGGLVLHRPEAQLWPQALSAIPLADTSSFVVTQVLNISQDHPDNLYVYIDTVDIPQCLFIDSIASIDSTITSINLATFGRAVKPVSVGPYLLFDIGFSLAASSYQKIRDSIYYNARDSLKFYFHWTCCPANFDSAIYLKLPFLLNWRCVGFPTSLPDNACHTPVPDSIPLLIQPAAFGNIPLVMQPDTFSNCDTLHFSVRVQSVDYGPIHGITNILDMPPGLTIVPGSLTVRYRTNNRDTTVHRTLSGDSVSIPPIVLHFQDTILLSFSAVPSCSYAGDAPTDMFNGISFCGTPVSPVVAFHSMISVGNQCGPRFTYNTVSNPLCFGDSTGSILIGADYSSSTYLYAISPSVRDTVLGGSHFVATHLPAGTYVITVTDTAKGCSRSDTDIVTQPAQVGGTVTIANVVPGNCSNNYATVAPSGGTSGYHFHWSGGSHTYSQTDSGLVWGLAYTVTVTDTNGCFAILRDTMPVQPVVSISGDSAVCSGSSATLNAGPGYSSYAWSTNASTQDIYPDNAGTYYVTVSLNGCLASDSFKLSVVPIPSPVATIAGYDLCSEDSNTYYSFSSTYGVNIPTYTLRQGTCTQVCSGSLSRIAVLLSHSGDVDTVTIVGGSDTLISSLSSDTLIYDIRWGAPGQGSISVNEVSPAGCNTPVSFCIDILPSPTANVGIIGMSNADTVNVCANSTLNFNDSSPIDTMSSNAGSANITWHWNFGDDSTSTQQSPTHSYSEPGTYTVVLTASSSCGCKGADSMVVVVGEASPMEIECPSVLCSGGSATYTASGCSSVAWGVIGGTITGHTGSSVTITWDSVGSGGFGYVIDTPVSCGTCHAPSSVKIPVITQNARINGALTICPNSPNYYSLPLWPGGVYHWSLVNGSPNPSVSMLTANDDYNVLIKAATYGTFTLKVKYTDPVAGCVDSSYVVVRVAASAVDSASPAVGCTNHAVTFTLSNSAVSRWSLVSPGGAVDTFGGTTSNSVIYTPVTAGNYVVNVISPNVCTGAPLTYHVDQTPSVANSIITGPDSVCRNTPYAYVDSPPAPAGVQYRWSLPNPGDGVIVGSNVGNRVVVKWTNAAYAAACTLRVTAMSTVNTSCVDTASRSYLVHIIEPDSVFNFPLTACANSVSGAVSAVSHAQDYYTWSFTPSNLASCVIGYDHSVHPQIQFNNVTTPTKVAITLTVTRCNKTVFKTDTVTIIPLPSVSVTADTPFCPLGSSIFVAHPSAAWPHTTYTWTINNGDTINTGTSTTLNYVFLDTGSYWVRVTAHFADTCIGSVSSARDSFRIRRCGSGIGGSGTSGTGGGPGTGGSGSPCPITFGTPTIRVFCNDSVSVTETYSPSGTLVSQSWSLDSASYFLVGTPSTSSVTSGSKYNFRVNHSGYYPLTYTVTLLVGGSTITCSTIILVKVPLHVGYTSTLQCNSSNSGYVLHLTDNSDYVGARPIYTWGTLPNVLPSGLDTGTSMTTGTLTGPFCRVSYTVDQGPLLCQVWFTVVVPTTPTAAFYYIDTPLATSPNSPNVCEGFSIKLQPTLTPQNPLWTYHWHDYHDGADIIYYNPAKEYDYNYVLAHGIVFDSISLHVTDNYGCSASTHSQRFTIKENLIGGRVGPFGSLVHPENAVYLCPGAGPFNFDYENFPSTQTGSPSHWNWYNAASPYLNRGRLGTAPISGPDGRYLCIATDQYGCQDISSPAGVIQTLPIPPVTISGTQHYCAGDTVVLTATLVDSMHYSWSLPGHANTAGNVWSIPNLAAGSYTETLTYTYTFANTGSTPVTCSQSTTFSFRVDSVPIVVGVIGSVTCSPYTVNLNAYGTLSTGYSWSNQATTQNTQVSSGGDYRVVLTSQGGCQAHYDVLVPDDPSLLIQYAPYGCYTYGCTTIDSAGVELTGPPNTIFAHWSWNVSGSPVRSGTNSPVAPYIAHYAGDYSLTLVDDISGSSYCNATSPLMHISASPVPCPVLCSLGAIGEELTCTGDSNIEIRVTNGTYSHDTFNLTSPSGTFVGVTPSSVGASGSYTFIYATFVPNLGVSGSIFVVVTVADSSGGCQDTLSIPLLDCKHGKSRPERDSTVLGKMLLMPNPASDIVKVVYSTGPTNGPLPAGETLTLSLTSVTGQLIEQQALGTVSGMVTVNVSAMKAGTYFVTLSRNHSTVATDKLEVLSR